MELADIYTCLKNGMFNVHCTYMPYTFLFRDIHGYLISIVSPVPFFAGVGEIHDSIVCYIQGIQELQWFSIHPCCRK